MVQKFIQKRAFPGRKIQYLLGHLHSSNNFSIYIELPHPPPKKKKQILSSLAHTCTINFLYQSSISSSVASSELGPDSEIPTENEFD